MTAKSAPPATVDKPALPAEVSQALAILADPETPLVDQAPLFAVLYRLQLAINRGIRAPKEALALAMATAGLDRIGPVRLVYKAKEVDYVCNGPGNWIDAGVQETLAGLAADPETSAFVREIPHHYEIDPKAIAGGMHDGDAAARQLWRQMNQHGWRVEVHPRAELEIDEVRLA